MVFDLAEVLGISTSESDEGALAAFLVVRGFESALVGFPFATFAMIVATRVKQCERLQKAANRRGRRAVLVGDIVVVKVC